MELLTVVALVNGVVIGEAYQSNASTASTTYQFPYVDITTVGTAYPYVGVQDNVNTTVTYRVEDTTHLVSSCTATVTITDDEAPTLADCSGLNVRGTTDTGKASKTSKTRATRI